MATRYWRGGSGTWDSSDTTNWSATSGGAGGASVPTAADDVIFNSASSAATYVVTCSFSQPECKSITTAAPAAGTLTFSSPGGYDYFKVYGGNINIHAACLFYTYGAVIRHYGNPAGGTLTVTFNGSGANSQNAAYSYLGSTANEVLSFCVSQTCSFYSVDISMYGGGTGTFTCTGSTITVVGGNFDTSPGTAQFTLTGSNGTINTINMTTTTLNIGGTLPSGSADYAGGGNLVMDTPTTLNAATLTVNLKDIGPTARQGYSTNCRIGGYDNVLPSNIGTLNISGWGDKNVYGNKFTNITHTAPSYIIDFRLYTYSTYLYRTISASAGTITGTIASTVIGRLYIADSYTVTGAVTNAAANLLSVANGGTTVTFNSTGTLAGSLSVDGGATATFVGALSVGNLSGTTGTASSYGSLNANTSLTLTTVNSNNVIGYLTTPTFTMADSSLETDWLTVNGGAGKTFSVTAVTAPRYILSNLCTINVATCSIVGTSPYRIRWNNPLPSNESLRVLSISGSTPTLTNVTFLGTAINSGATNYSGTRLGTDGLSTGFAAQAGQTVYLKTVTGYYALQDAIWALTPGGAVSSNNMPLPQDTLLIGDDTNGQNISVYYGDIVCLGTVTTTSTAGAFSAGSGLYVFGSVITSASSSTQGLYGLTMSKSNQTDRYLLFADRLLISSGSGFGIPPLTIDVGVGTQLTVGNLSGSGGVPVLYTSGVTIASGSIVFAGRPVIGEAYSYLGDWDVGTLGTTTLSGVFSGYANDVTYYSGTTINTSNYTFYMAATSSLSFVTYTNNAVSTAKNGVVVNLGYRLIVTGSGTSTANPIRALTFAFGVAGTGSNRTSLNGNVYVQDLISSVTAPSVAPTLDAYTGNPTIYKTNGGTVYFSKSGGTGVTVNNVKASPDNTFYTNGSRVGTTTGWNSGTPPSSANSGFFFF